MQDRGNAVQSRLWDSWGGPPTRQLLQHLGNPEPEHLSWRRQEVQRVVGSRLTLPDPAAEQQAPAEAAATYDQAVAVLRSRTRQRLDHPTVFAENVAYGFRRNCLALRPMAIGLAVGTAVFCTFAGALVGLTGRHLGPSAWLWATGGLGGGAFALGWWRIVTPNWVREAGVRYAHALFDAALLL